MRTIIAGSRGVQRYATVEKAIIDSGFKPTIVLSGTANGVDKLGEYWAQRNGVPVQRYPADWERYGKSAGYKRNVFMAERAEALIAVWDGRSKGTEHMINIALRHGLHVYVFTL